MKFVDKAFLEQFYLDEARCVYSITANDVQKIEFYLKSVAMFFGRKAGMHPDWVDIESHGSDLIVSIMGSDHTTVHRHVIEDETPDEVIAWALDIFKHDYGFEVPPPYELP